ncbi:family 20 glycosylhydrolase [Streptomyces aurantiacus]|uniref:Putative Beta-hexosaminidase subunit beta n=1 Tax=Streptomyces aurantiacus JA 4570 TaxID=1286094 RepID=S4AGU2_9ACTN|nr:family 20 glycosylhydrolase [Streptomyces aurantiacus]EPH40722.1 putative Beta-hexosaminidase subunit beta [Streptomyces aurantiacus JA 4570]
MTVFPELARRPRGRWRRLTGAAAALLLLVAPAPAAASRQDERPGPPRTLPALTNWTPGEGSYTYGDGVRLVARDAASRRVARTLADDLRAAGRGKVPVTSGAARPGDVLIDVEKQRKSLGAEGYELRAGERLEITGGTEAGAFYGTRTLLQLLAQGDRIPAGSTVDVPRYKERGVGVCACYIHISRPWLENLIRDMAYRKQNQLLLELKVKSDRHPEANSWGYYSKSDIRRLVALAAKYHITVIPEINSPGHMDPWLEHRPDLQLTDTDGKKQPSRLDVTKDESFAYYTSLVDEYADVFPAKSWHMGADEYMLGSDFAKYPHIRDYARRKYGEHATPQDAFIDFVNRVQAYTAGKGKRLRIWNDGLTGDNTVPVAAGTTVEHWLAVRTKPGELIARGHPLMNAAYALYLVRGGFHSDTRKLYEQRWDPRVFEGETLASRAGVTGAKISLWPDNGRGETENEVAASMRLPLSHVAQVTWGSPHPDGTYAGFTARDAAVGHAPGWRDLTEPPVADGTYTLRDVAGGLPPTAFEIRRTPDGYVTLRSARTGACLETREGKLTLNVPLEPGSSVTQETCDAKNTLQRWQLTPVRGGHRLTNAITRMAAHVTGDGRIAQYPPDQRTPTTWQLTPEAREYRRT